MPTHAELFISFSSGKLRQLAGRIEQCLEKLNDSQIWARGSDAENAVGNLVLHLCGNVRQWIGYGAGGLDDIRERDREFDTRGGMSRAELSARLASTISEAASIIDAIPAARLLERTKIQNYDMTVLEAIYHAVEHFAHHTGQIIFATKMLTGSDLGFYRHLSKPAHKEKVP